MSLTQINLVEIKEKNAAVVLVRSRSILEMHKEDMFKKACMNDSAFAYGTLSAAQVPGLL